LWDRAVLYKRKLIAGKSRLPEIRSRTDGFKRRSGGRWQTWAHSRQRMHRLWKHFLNAVKFVLSPAPLQPAISLSHTASLLRHDEDGEGQDQGRGPCSGTPRVRHKRLDTTTPVIPIYTHTIYSVSQYQRLVAKVTRVVTALVTGRWGKRDPGSKSAP
jgi:hypothetical protein